MKISNTENIYIVCFDLNKLRLKFDPNDQFNSEIAVEFMEECMGLKDKLSELFPNLAIQISNDSFLIKTLLTSEILLKLLIEKFSERVFGTQAGENVKHQIYIAEIQSLEGSTLRAKQFEIEYLEQALCKSS